jgi:ABC-type Mn2+/Zn2+ transport system permease subunit
MPVMLDVLIPGLLTGISVGLSTGYLGSLMVLKRMSLVGDALSHVALPGLALGILFNFNPFIGAFTFLFGSAVIIWRLERITKLSFETIVGAMFTLALAIGILIIPEVDLLEALFGDISSVTFVDAIVAIIVSAIAISMTIIVYSKFIMGMISEDLAISAGINIGRINLMYLLLVSLTVAAGIKIVGSLLVGFLVSVPAATAKTISPNLRRYSMLSSFFGAISGISGVLLSNFTGLPTGPLVVVSGVTVFVVVALIRWATKYTT